MREVMRIIRTLTEKTLLTTSITMKEVTKHLKISMLKIPRISQLKTQVSIEIEAALTSFVSSFSGFS
jgi:hypothetical protein